MLILLKKLQNNLKRSPRTRTILLYLFFVVISAVFWSFLTFNRDLKLDIKVPVTITMPDNVHLLSRVTDTLTVTVTDRGYRFFSYMFRKSPSLTLRFGDYNDGNGYFKVDQSHLKKALAAVLNKHATIESVLPENINIKYTDLPGKKVPVKTDIIVEAREDYTLYGALIQSLDSVLVFSDAKTLNEINEVYTYHVEEKNLTDTLRRKVTIAPINGAVIEPRAIDITVPIEKLKSQTRTVKIVVRNAPQGVKMLLFPSDVEVTYRSPVSRIKDDTDITAVVDYNELDFASPSNKVKVMIGEMPAAYQDVTLSHDSVEYIIEKH
jgi:YbbR domain-containing protein